MFITQYTGSVPQKRHRPCQGSEPRAGVVRAHCKNAMTALDEYESRRRTKRVCTWASDLGNVWMLTRA